VPPNHRLQTDGRPYRELGSRAIAGGDQRHVRTRNSEADRPQLKRVR